VYEITPAVARLACFVISGLLHDVTQRQMAFGDDNA